MNEHPVLKLKKGREKPVLRRHPWIFSGAVSSAPGGIQSGETIAVQAADGTFLAWASYSPQSQIRARVLSRDPDELVNEDFFAKKIKHALQMRDLPEKDGKYAAARILFAEADGLPGVIADQYADVVVLQLLSAGAEYWKEELVRILMEKTGCRLVYERSDAEVRNLEGLEPRGGLLAGDDPPGRVVIKENGIIFHIDILQGHKTGFYLDQRANRARVRQLAEGRAVLDCFSYTGGFAVNALAGGAEYVTAVEESGEALRMAQQHAELNNLDLSRLEMVQADVFKALRTFRDQGRSFDMVVLDPPKFAPTASHASQAARGYKDINLLAMKLLRPGGLLVTFSCSGGIDRKFFQKIIAGAALDAEVDAMILEHLSQGPDHPIALNYPESEYLKGFVLRID